MATDENRDKEDEKTEELPDLSMTLMFYKGQ